MSREKIKLALLSTSLFVAVCASPVFAEIIDTASGLPSVKIDAPRAGNSAFLDFNGDGIDDLAVHSSDPPWYMYVLYGSQNMPEPQVLSAWSQFDHTIVPPSDVVSFGSFVAGGDVNGDGIDDLLIKANSPGAIHIIYGQRTLTTGSVRDLNVDPADWIIFAGIGDAFATGYVNDDSFADILIGARQADPNGKANAGEAYLVLGSNAFPPHHSIDLANTPPAVTIQGRDPGDNLATDVALGDINGDGLDDMICGAFQADPGLPGRGTCGEVYAVWGRSSYSANVTVDFSDLAHSPDLEILGDGTGDNLGNDVAAGDLNGDGIDELIAGAPWWHTFETPPYEGRVYAIMGSRDFTPHQIIDLRGNSTTNMLIFQGTQNRDNLFRSEVLDFNGDGYMDIVLSAEEHNWSGRSNCGAVFLVLGGPHWYSQRVMDVSEITSEVSLMGRDDNHELGFLLKPGDLNGDGLQDFAALEPAGYGELYVVFSRPAEPAMRASPSWQYY